MSYFLYRGFPVEVVGVHEIGSSPYRGRVLCDTHFDTNATHTAYYTQAPEPRCYATHLCPACAEKAKAAIGVPYLKALKEALADI